MEDFIKTCQSIKDQMPPNAHLEDLCLIADILNAKAIELAMPHRVQFIAWPPYTYVLMIGDGSKFPSFYLT